MQPPLTSPLLPRFRPIAAATLGIAGLLACGSPGPAPSSRPGAPPAPEATPPARSTGRWTLRRAPGEVRYEIRNSAVIELAGDSVPGDSLATTMVVSLVLADSAGLLSVTGRIDSLHVARGARITTRDSTPPLPIPVHAVLDHQGGVIRLGGPDTLAGPLCLTTLDPITSAARELFVRLPERLTRGTEWQDTTRTTSCRGRIPVTTTTIASYDVLGERVAGGRPVIAIARTTAISLAGGGEQHSRAATVQGSGTGTGTLLFDPETAALVEGESRSTTMVTFEAGMLRQTFTQHARQEIRQR